MMIAWIATKPVPKSIKTFCDACWEIKEFTPFEFMSGNLLSRSDFDIIVIETMDRSLLDICGEICHEQIAPVLAVAGDLAYAQAALEAGADDFLMAPVEPIEAILRVRKLARSASIIRVGDLEVDLLAWNVSYRGHRIHLSTVEFRLLATLAKRVGQLVDHATILEEVWKSEPAQKAPAQLRSYVGRVRRKIEPDPQNPQYIISVAGAGYRLRNQRQWQARQREAGRASLSL